MKSTLTLLACFASACTSAHAQIKPAAGYKVEQVVAPSAFHGIHGLAFDANDRLYAGSVVGQSVYRVETTTGKVETVVGPPDGQADDLVFLRDGTMVWTSILQNAVRAQKPGGAIEVWADNLASPNSINVRKTDGRLFVAQVFGGDGLWELYPEGDQPRRNILKDLGGLNGFDIGPDGWIYGPLWFKKQVVKINPDNGELKVVADGFHTPAAANFDSKWNLYVLDTALGTVNRIDIKTGKKQVVAQLQTSLDNLAIDSKDRLFVSNMADNGIQEVDVATGKARQVVKGKLAMPMGLAVVGDTLYVADVFAFRSVDGTNGRITDLQRAHAAGAHIGYPVAVSANERHVLVIGSTGTLQKYTRADNKLVTEWTLRGLAGAVELPDGDILAAVGSSLVRLDAKGQTTVTADVGRPHSLVLGGGGVYFAEGATGQLMHVNLTTGAKRSVGAPIKIPQGLALDARGQLLTVEFGTRRLLSIDPTTGSIAEIATQLPIGFRGPDLPERTIGLAIGKSGALYVTSDIENSIYRIRKE